MEPKTVTFDEAARDLPGLLDRLKPGERVTITDADGHALLEGARPAGAFTEEDLRTDPQAWLAALRALAEETAAHWQGPADAVAVMREERT